MSIRVMNEVWESRKFEGNQLLLLLALADFASDDGGNVFPSVEKMAEKTRASRRTVQRNLRKLEDEGVLIEVRPASQRFPAEYRIVLEALRRPPEGEGRYGDAPEGRQGRHSDHPGASSATILGRHGDAQTVKKNPSRESVNGREREKILKEEFDDWYQHYPKKVSRGAAEKALARARREGVSLETLIAGAKRYAAEMAGKESQFIRYPATWLNGKCWLDEPGPLSQTGLTWWQKREIDESARGERYGEEVDLGNNGRQ